MLERLKELALRKEDLEAQLADPAVYGDGGRLRSLQRELKELTPVVEAWQALDGAERRREEAEALLRDPELKALAQEELSAAREEAERLREELKILLLPADPNDGRNVILELRGGVGGEEGALFAHSLLRMYGMYAQRRRNGRCRSASPWDRSPRPPLPPRAARPRWRRWCESVLRTPSPVPAGPGERRSQISGGKKPLPPR